jgi:hypothetical protein
MELVEVILAIVFFIGFLIAIAAFIALIWLGIKAFRYWRSR